MNHLQKYSLRIADNSWILGNRLGEYSSKGPFLEEDLAITNVGLDHIGLAEGVYKYVADLDGTKSADDFAFRRAEHEYYNIQLVEYPNEDFAYIMARQFLFDVYQFFFLEALAESKDETLAALAQKSLKEVTYHLRRSTQWMYRLGDGTEVSHIKIQGALNHLWMYKDELFFMDETDEEMIKVGVGVDLKAVQDKWNERVEEVLTKATLTLPEMPVYSLEYGKNGHHTDHMGYILLDIQYLNNKYPDAKW
ncbi:MAG: phenylacetate-CoA oxygenase subunit PaaC [Flavobacteriales bacterium]|jgi:ring-1,2-phenylacetyl-CoA epoxidase subunit PaaC|nr:phenylacetate-CoA oxygenase subunit PaaC [Flavobacteriales bacterium]